MANLCRVFVVGNFQRDIERSVGDDGTVIGTSVLCVGRTTLRRGHPEHQIVQIPFEVIGAARVASVAQQFGAGSRVLIEGHLEGRRSGATPLVLVVDTILNAEIPAPAAEAVRQPRQRFGEWENLS